MKKSISKKPHALKISHPHHPPKILTAEGYRRFLMKKMKSAK